MALDANIRGSTSGNGAEVDANNNLKVALPTTPDQSGLVQLAGQLSAATDPAGLVVERLRSSAQGRLSVGQPVALFSELFNNTAINSAVFTAPVTTMTVTFAGGTANLNASAINTINTNARLATYQHFPFLVDMATYLVMDMLYTQPPQNNNLMEWGFGICTGATAPIDGAFFRMNASGQLLAVVNINGAETVSAALAIPADNIMHRYRIVVENDRVFFSVDGATQAIITTPNTAGFPLYSPAQPFFARVVNTGVAPTLASVMKIGSLYVALQDAAGLHSDGETLLSIRGRHGSQGQTGHTVGSTALLTNSLAPGAGVAMTNTTAALGTGLGGQFAALPTLAANTDGIVCSYQNPLPTAAIPAKTLLIRGVRIQSIVSTVLAGGPVLYEYSLCYGHTAVSLATTEAATTKAPRRLPIGIETFAANAAVGTVGSAGGQYMSFTNPIAVMPGEFVAIAAKNIGTVTTTGVVMFIVTFDAVFF